MRHMIHIIQRAAQGAVLIQHPAGAPRRSSSPARAGSSRTLPREPAFAGTELGAFAPSATASSGGHWAPSTSSVTVTSSLPSRFGFGFAVERDDQGAYRRTGFELASTYTIDLNNKDAVAFGLGLMGRTPASTVPTSSSGRVTWPSWATWRATSPSTPALV